MPRLLLDSNIQKHWVILLILMCVELALYNLLDAGYRNAGSLSLARGNVSAASDWFCRSTEPSLETRLGQVRTSILVKDFDMMEQLLPSAPHRADTMMPIWLLDTASGLLEAGDTHSALRRVNLVVISGQVNFQLLYNLGLLYERAGAREQARKAFVAGAQHDSSGILAEGWYYLARLQYIAQEWQATIDTLGPTLANVPDSALNVPRLGEKHCYCQPLICAS